MKAQDLKNSILQMAMEGKLVPQDPNDEPASLLLEKIKEEKEQLIKEKKIKRNNKESVIFRKNNHFFEKVGKKGGEVCIDDEIPFVVPNNWELCRLNVVNNIYTGNSINKTEKESKFMGLTEGYNYIATKDVGFDNTIDYKNGVKIPIDLEKFRVAQSGSVLLCIEGGSAGRKIALTNEDVCFGNKLCCFTSFGIDVEFLYFYLQSPIFKEVFKSEKTGIIGGVSIGKIRNFLVPLPPLKEQKRIVNKIKEFIPLIEDYDIFEEELNNLNLEFPKKIKNSILQEAIQGKLVPQDSDDEPASVLLKRIKEEKEHLIKSKKIKRNNKESVLFRKENHFYEKIGKKEPFCIDDDLPFEIPESWEWCTMNQCFDVRDGTHDTPKYVKEGIPLVTSKNLDNGSIDFSGAKFISLEDHNFISKRSCVDDGDILFAMIGTIGNPVIVLKDREFSIKNVALFKPFLSDINMKYLYYYLLFAQEKMKKNASGAVQSFVSLTVLRNYYIPIPPLNEQNRIVEKIEQLFLTLEKS